MDLLYKERRKQQMLRFFGATTLTLISCRFTMKFLIPRVESPSVNNLVKKHCMSELLLSFPLLLFICYRDKYKVVHINIYILLTLYLSFLLICH